MTNQEFSDFQANVEATAVAYENQPDGSTVVTCSDGTLLHVTADGRSQIMEPR